MQKFVEGMAQLAAELILDGAFDASSGHVRPE
jgi:hypothetical protein